MTSDIRALLTEVQQSIQPSLWSKGVELSRQDAVTGDSLSEDEIVLRVFNRDRGVSPTVRLYPVDLDWNCTCNEPADPCVHVAAAVIAMRRAQERGDSLPKSKTAAGKIRYEFAESTDEQGRVVLKLLRKVENGEAAAELKGFLTKQSSDGGVSPTSLDMEVDTFLLRTIREEVTYAYWQVLFGLLVKSEDPITLNGEQVTFEKEVRGYVLEVEEQNSQGDMVLRLKVADEIDKRFTNHVGMLKNRILFPLYLPKLDGLPVKLQLGEETTVARTYRSELFGEWLPQCEKFMTVILPESQQQTNIKPRLDLRLKKEGQGFRVFPRVVYGDPVVAEVDASGQLRLLSGTQVPRRNHDAERTLRDELWRGAKLNLWQAQDFSGPDAVDKASVLRKWGVDIGGGVELKKYRDHGVLRPNLAFRGFEMDLSFSVDASGGAESGSAKVSAVLEAWEQGDRWINLDSGGIARLPIDWLQRYGALLSELMEKQEKRDSDKIVLDPAAAPVVEVLCEEFEREVPEKFKSVLAKLRNYEDVDVEIPPLKATLRSYQEDGIRWLLVRKQLGLGALLADDMGLGKTLQSMATLESLSLVVCPRSVLANWKRELETFRPELHAEVYHGANRSLKDQKQVDVYITSYGTMRQDIAELEKISWQAVILDESQQIKNPDSQIAQAAIRLKSNFSLALSGTPVENSLKRPLVSVSFFEPERAGKQAEV